MRNRLACLCCGAKVKQDHANCPVCRKAVLRVIDCRFEQRQLVAVNGDSVTECCYVQLGEDTDSFHAQPVVLGKNGVESIPPLPPLSDYEQKLLDEMREVLDGNISKGLEFANS